MDLSKMAAQENPEFTLQMDTPNLKKMWKLDELFSTTKDKRATSRWLNKSETLFHQANPGLVTHKREGSHQTGTSLRVMRGWCPTSGIQPLGYVLERQNPRKSSLENQQDWYPEVPKCCRKLRLYVREIHLLIQKHWLEGQGTVATLPVVEPLADALVAFFM